MCPINLLSGAKPLKIFLKYSPQTKINNLADNIKERLFYLHQQSQFAMVYLGVDSYGRMQIVEQPLKNWLCSPIQASGSPCKLPAPYMSNRLPTN